MGWEVFTKQKLHVFLQFLPIHFIVSYFGQM